MGEVSVITVTNPIDWILARRSIRKFHDNPITDDQLDTMLKAAMAGPSANNRRPWHFIAVRDRSILNRIAEIHPYAKMCYEATAAIMVCGDPEISSRYWSQDCSAATENILLAGTAMGLGTCWLAMDSEHPLTRELKDLLNVPDHIEILSGVAIGYPAEQKKPRSQYESAKVHFERW